MALAELATALILTTAPSQVANFDKEALKLEIEKAAIVSIQQSIETDLSTIELKVASKSFASKPSVSLGE